MLLAFLIAGTMWMGSPSAAIANDSQYLKEIIALEDDMVVNRLPAKSQVFERSYEMLTTTWEEESVKSSVRSFQSADAIHYSNGDYSMYLDRSDVFLVDHSSKSIYRSASTPDAFSTSTNDVMALRREFLRGCKVVQTQDLPDGRRYVKLAPGNHQLPGLNLESMEYIYIPEDKILGVTANYGSEYKVKSVLMSDVVFNTKSKKNLAKPVARLILDANQKLQSKYKGYTLIDNRNH
jgi:hypothetical protein